MKVRFKTPAHQMDQQGREQHLGNRDRVPRHRLATPEHNQNQRHQTEQRPEQQPRRDMDVHRALAPRPCLRGERQRRNDGPKELHHKQNTKQHIGPSMHA